MYRLTSEVSTTGRARKMGEQQRCLQDRLQWFPQGRSCVQASRPWDEPKHSCLHDRLLGTPAWGQNNHQFETMRRPLQQTQQRPCSWAYSRLNDEQNHALSTATCQNAPDILMILPCPSFSQSAHPSFATCTARPVAPSARSGHLTDTRSPIQKFPLHSVACVSRANSPHGPRGNTTPVCPPLHTPPPAAQSPPA